MDAVKAKEIMKSPIITASASASVEEIARIMRDREIGGVVIEKGGKLCGIITRKDIVYKVVAEGKDPKKVKAEEIMSKPLITVDANDNLTEIARKMGKHDIRRVVVVNRGQPVGVISDKDVLRVAPEIIEILSEYLRILR